MALDERRNLPLLLFPRATPSVRENRPPAFPQVQFPSIGRQNARLSPKFNELQQAFDAQRMRLQADAPGDDPEKILVLEVIGDVQNFINAVRKTPGLEWLLELTENNIEPDDDFYDRNDREKRLSGKLFLLGSNRQALLQITSLWNRYKENPGVTLERGLAPWKAAFAHLKDVRFWGVEDRVTDNIKQYWDIQLESGIEHFRFEIEAWCYSSTLKNQQSAAEINRLVAELGGQVLNSALLPNISYHGFLITMPANGVRQLLSNTPPQLLLSERVMQFSLQGQALADPVDDQSRLPPVDVPDQQVNGEPVIALLDGLPLQNHPLLAGRLIIHDPDNWEQTYEARDRVHGTSMSSLIIWGELDGPRIPLRRPIYVRPILRTNPADNRNPRRESTPNDILIIDLVLRAVREMFEWEGDAEPAAPNVKVINLSVGDPDREFGSKLSPWARLIDWLSFKYNVLFVISAGNTDESLTLGTPRYSLANLTPEARINFALRATVSDVTNRRLIAPAESINSITVGAANIDSAPLQNLNGSYELFNDRGITSYSRIGHGFRRSIKPEILMPGGKTLFREAINGNPNSSIVSYIHSNAAPGHRVAAPPEAGGDTIYTRGSSNAAALATRAAAGAYEVIQLLKSSSEDLQSNRYDTVLLKALLAHGAEWGETENLIVNARPDIAEWQKKKDLVTRFIGYGLSDVDKALTCTEQRATLIGFGVVTDGNALEFRAPLPPSLNAQRINRRLTITLAWISPVNSQHSKYRSALLWVRPPQDDLNASRLNCNWQQVRNGTLQHEICEGDDALAFVDGQNLIFKVNCVADAGKLETPIRFALCVTIEVAEELTLPIYQEIRERIQPRVEVGI